MRGADVTVASADPDATLPTLTAVACGDDCPRDGVDLLLPAEEEIDAMAYARSGALIVGTTLRGAPPEVGWTMDVEVCTEGHATTR